MPDVVVRHFHFGAELCENLLVKVSAVIIAFNEEAKIGDAIRSVDFADEVLVVDSESTDRTREIAQSLGARVIEKPWAGFSIQKQFATDQAAHDRILSIDADERITPELRAEILNALETGSPADAYRIPRLAIYMGREIRHSGWYPDRQLRFFDRRRGRWKQVEIHESVEMDVGSKVETMKSNILHLTVDTPGEHLRMIRTRYAPKSAEAMSRAGRRGSIVKMLGLPPITFLQTYVLKAGFLDGSRGLRISAYASYNVYLKHLLLREIQRK